jgi:hypothetical protein
MAKKETEVGVLGKLPDLMKATSTGGMLNEILLKVDEKGVASVEAVDLSTTVLISMKVKTSLPAMEIGIPDLNVFISLLDIATSLELVEDRWLVIKTHRGRTKILTTVPSQVPTVAEVSSELNFDGVDIPLSLESVENVCYFVNLFGTQTITFTVKAGKLILSSSKNESRQWSIPLPVTSVTEEFSVKGYATPFVKIMKMFTEPPVIKLAPSCPIVIHAQTPLKGFWAINPIEVAE